MARHHTEGEDSFVKGIKYTLQLSSKDLLLNLKLKANVAMTDNLKKAEISIFATNLLLYVYEFHYTLKVYAKSLS